MTTETVAREFIQLANFAFTEGQLSEAAKVIAEELAAEHGLSDSLLWRDTLTIS